MRVATAVHRVARVIMRLIAASSRTTLAIAAHSTPAMGRTPDGRGPPGAGTSAGLACPHVVHCRRRAPAIRPRAMLQLFNRGPREGRARSSRRPVAAIVGLVVLLAVRPVATLAAERSFAAPAAEPAGTAEAPPPGPSSLEISDGEPLHAWRAEDLPAALHLTTLDSSAAAGGASVPASGERHWSSLPLLGEQGWRSGSEAGDGAPILATKRAPWYVVPADNKWFTRVVVAAAAIEALSSLDLAYPTVSAAKLKDLAAAKRSLLAEK